MTTTTCTPAEADRRAELLLARYAALADGNPGFHFDGHMQALESGVDADSVTAALVRGSRTTRQSDAPRF